MKTTSRSAQAISPYVRPLAMASDEKAVGAKAWNLARMLRLGIAVPRGFVVTDLSFQRFLDLNRLRDPIADIRGNVDPRDIEGLSRTAASIRVLIQDAAVPEGVRQAVRHCRVDLGDGTLIVRSSAVGEDSSNHSFAGQLDSFRDIRSAEDLEDALLGCWASCWSERALSYQISRGVRIERMGVVIQEQVQSSVSGVLFSATPGMSTEASEMVGEYCLGHGEDLVSGRINPGRFTIRRKSFDCRHVACPEQAGANGSPDEALDRETIRHLHRTALMLENEFEGPQDIEWTIDASGRLQIVQTRPLTTPGSRTLPPRKPLCDPGTPLIAWSNANINENYPDPVSPFLYSVAADGYYHYFRNLARAFGIVRCRIAEMDQPLRNTIGVHAGRLYYNLTNIHAALRMAPFGDHLVEWFNVFVGAGDDSVPSSRPPVAGSSNGDRNPRGDAVAENTCRKAGPGAFVSLASELAWVAIKTSWQFLFLDKRVSAFERAVDEYARRTHPARLSRMSLPELRSALRSFLDIRRRRWTNASLADAASMISYGLLKNITGQAFPGQEHSARHNRLLQGLPDLVSAKPVLELWKLSRRVQADPALVQVFACSNTSEIWERLQGDESWAAFREPFDDFLEHWGFRCSGELMMTVKSFQEDPSGVIPLLKSYVSFEGESPADLLKRQAAERRVEAERLYRALRPRRAARFLAWPNLATLARVVLGWTQRAIGFRERARLKQSLLYSRCRRVALRMGEELSRRGLLRQPEDVFFVTHQELDSLASGTYMFPDTVRALIESRRAEHVRFGGMTLPDSMMLPEGTYLAEVAPESKRDSSEAEEQDAMRGVGACGGRVTARATVLSDVTESALLAAGDVLVARQTDPGWAPVFFLVSGLIMERGGMLSHGAIVARECGIPTVVGVRDATRKIRSGQTVSVDGDAGCVRIVG